nr:unnamed protein product [Callosobruchus analis]
MEKMISGQTYSTNATPEQQENHSKKVSKVMETVIDTPLLKYLDNNNIIHDRQYIVIIGVQMITWNKPLTSGTQQYIIMATDLYML